MSRLVCLTLVFAGCGTAIPTLKPPSLELTTHPLRYEFAYQQWNADNGATLIVAPDDKTNLLKVDVRYRVGAAEDPPGKSGLAHLVEHLMFQLPSTSGNSPTISQQLERLALTHNAYTTWDETHYMTVANDNLLTAMLLFESRRMSATCDDISQPVFEREREVVRNEIRQRTGIGSTMVRHLYRDVYGSEHPYHRSTGGTDTTLASITRQDVCAFIERYYTPERAIVVVSGHIQQQLASRLFTRFFGPLKPGESRARAPIEAPSLTGETSTHKLAVREATALIAFPRLRFSNTKTAYQQLAGQLMKSRLLALRRRTSFITAIDIAHAGGTRAPLNVISVSVTEPSKLKKAVDLIFAESEKLTDNLTSTLMSAMIETARARLLTSVEPFMSEAIAIADYAQYAQLKDFIIPMLRAYGAIDGDQLRVFAPNYFRRDRSHVMHVYPDDSVEPAEQRADLVFSHRDYEFEDWRRIVDTKQADKDLRITDDSIRAWVREFELKNGLRVLLAPELGYPVVDIRLVLPGGELHDPPDKPGLARMAIQAMDTGRFQFSGGLPPGMGKFAFDVVQRVGGPITGTWQKTASTLRVSGTAQYVEVLLWKLYWQMSTVTYSKKYLKSARDIASRRDAIDIEKNERAIRRLLETLYGPEHPYANKLSSTERLARISTRDLHRFRKQHHGMDGATLIVTGQFPPARVEDEIRRLFGELPRGRQSAVPAIPEPSTDRASRHLAIVSDDRIQTHIVLAFATPNRGRAAEAERKVAKQMLRLRMSALREQLGSTYGVQVDYVSDVGPGMVLITASVDRTRVTETYRAMIAALDDIRAGNALTAFVHARRHVLRHLLAESVYTKSVADELERSAALGLPKDHGNALARNVATLRLGDVQAVLDQDLQMDAMVTLLNGRRESIQRAYDSVNVTDFIVIE